MKNVLDVKIVKKLWLTAVSRNCWFLFLSVHEKRLSLTENNQLAGVATVAKARNVSNKVTKIAKV